MYRRRVRGIRPPRPTERERELLGVIAHFTALHMDQARLLREHGFLPPDDAVTSLLDESFNPNTFAQALADRFYGGNTRQGVILLAKMLVSSLYQDED